MKDMINVMTLGNSVEELKKIPDNSVGCCITDAPYEISMSKEKTGDKAWDSTGIAFSVEFWKEVYRVMKPGAFLLAFGSARTFHRLAIAIEESSFVLKEFLFWSYAQGMPKGLNISKAIDKKYGSIPEVELLKGFNTQLKPSVEPIVFAQKPLDGTYVNNVLKWGVGGLNIDACRIPVKDTVNYERNVKGNERIKGKEEGEKIGLHEGGWKVDKTPKEVPEGRFPTNFILDECMAKELDRQSGHSKSADNVRHNHKGTTSKDKHIYGTYQDALGYGYADEGGASRFFTTVEYDAVDLVPFIHCKKASKTEKGEYNNHISVKPIKLMKYLVSLVCPPNEICLDPFAGSGSTALACIDNDIDFIAIEMLEEHVEIANRRIEGFKKGCV